jgi:hypothetical protein
MENNRPSVYIVHPGTKTVIAADECVIHIPDDPDTLIDGIENGSIDPLLGSRPVPHPDFVLSFEPDAIREHYEGLNPDEVPAAPLVAGMDDAELLEVADRAMTDDRLYITFHDVVDDTLTDWINREE